MLGDEKGRRARLQLLPSAADQSQLNSAKEKKNLNKKLLLFFHDS